MKNLDNFLSKKFTTMEEKDDATRPRSSTR